MPEALIVALFSMNSLILGGIAYNSFRIGKIQGRLENGDYLRCPFYKAKNKGCVNGKRRKGD